jgi:hypothetical protein
MALTAKHRAALEMVADPMDTRTLEDKARAAGISAVTLWRLRKKPEALEYVAKRLDEIRGAIEPRVWQALYAELDGKDRVQAARVLFQALGVVGSGGVNVTTNVTQTTETFEDFIGRITKERAGVASEE